MTDQEIQKQIALLLGWKILDPPETISGRGDYSFLATWVDPNGLKLKERSIPPWPTDDGTAIKALAQWSRANSCESHCEYVGVNDEWGVFIWTDPLDALTMRFAENKSLARAISEAMIAAHKSMEGTK